MRGEQDPHRPSWRLRTPAGAELSVEFDRLRQLWRVTPGGYTRRTLAAALADATGQRPDADWISELERQLEAEQRQRLGKQLTSLQ